MPITATQAADFALYARKPETWAIAARRQLSVAMHLFKHKESLRLAANVSFEERSGTHYAAYLHAGYALENAAKAALVARDPEVITDKGSINKSKLGPKGGHGLRSIAEAVLANLSNDDVRLLEKLQEYVVWAGRYTIPLSAEVLYDEEVMDNLRVAPIGEIERVRELVEQLLAKAGVRA